MFQSKGLIVNLNLNGQQHCFKGSTKLGIPTWLLDITLILLPIPNIEILILPQLEVSSTFETSLANNIKHNPGNMLETILGYDRMLISYSRIMDPLPILIMK